MVEAVEVAMTGWVQVQSNQVKKCYEINHPSIDYPEPDWSSMLGDATAQELFTRIFKGRVIDSADHEQLEIVSQLSKRKPETQSIFCQSINR